MNYEKDKQRMCFISCLAHVVIMAGVMQTRQPQEEGETPKREKPEGTPWGSLYQQTPPECPHPEKLSTKQG